MALIEVYGSGPGRLHKLSVYESTIMECSGSDKYRYFVVAAVMEAS